MAAKLLPPSLCHKSRSLGELSSSSFGTSPLRPMRSCHASRARGVVTLALRWSGTAAATGDVFWGPDAALFSLSESSSTAMTSAAPRTAEVLGPAGLSCCLASAASDSGGVGRNWNFCNLLFVTSETGGRGLWGREVCWAAEWLLDLCKWCGRCERRLSKCMERLQDPRDGRIHVYLR